MGVKSSYNESVSGNQFGVKKNVSPASECGHSLMTETGKLFETFSFCSWLTRFVAQEYFINSSRPCSENSNMIKLNVVIAVTVQ